MDEIVWAINPQHDTLDSLMAYLKVTPEIFWELQASAAALMPL